MLPDPAERYRLLRRLTVAATAMSVGLAGLVYLEVSGLMRGPVDNITGPARLSPDETGVIPQPPGANPTSGIGNPIVRTGGS